MIDRVLDRFALWIEITLAVALIAAVLLNFANAVGRYLLGISLLWADEVQVFIMVALTFLGAAVVTRRNQHLRMDVLVQFLPAPMHLLLRVIEQLMLTALIGFVAVQSFVYSRQIFLVGRTSDMGGIPMWIPHGTVFVGLGLMFISIVCGLIRLARRIPEPAPPQLERALGGEIKQ